MPLRPVLYMLLSGMAFSIMYLLAKQLAHLGGFTITLFRGLGTFLPTLVFLLVQKIPLAGNRTKMLSLRALTGASSLVLFFIAIEDVPITAAVAVRYLSPIIAVAIVAWRLGERVRGRQWLLFGLAFMGVLLIKGFDPRVASFGLTLILLSAILDGITFTIIRALGTSEHPMVIVVWFTGAATLMGLLGLLLFPNQLVWPNADDWPRLISIGLVGLIGQYFMTVAMQTGRASQVMPVKYVEAVFLLLLSSFFLDEIYTPLALTGIALIVVANVGNLLVRQANNDRTPP